MYLINNLISSAAIQRQISTSNSLIRPFPATIDLNNFDKNKINSLWKIHL